MLYPTITFEPNDRDPDGMYAIPSGTVHVFPFQVPVMGQQLITMRHHFPSAQDWSISAWFTKKPLDGTLFPNLDNWDDFRMSTDDREYPIWAEGSPEESEVYLPPLTTYYLNVKNLQNRDNGYILTFSF